MRSEVTVLLAGDLPFLTSEFVDLLVGVKALVVTNQLRAQEPGQRQADKAHRRTPFDPRPSASDRILES